MTGRVEAAVRTAVSPGDLLATPSGRGHFTVACYSPAEMVLLLGAKETRTPVPWRAVEEIPDFLRGRDWVPIGTAYTTDSRAGTLDAHLKGFLNTATAGWIAVVLENAAVLAIDRSPPARIKLRPGW